MTPAFRVPCTKNGAPNGFGGPAGLVGHPHLAGPPAHRLWLTQRFIRGYPRSVNTLSMVSLVDSGSSVARWFGPSGARFRLTAMSLWAADLLEGSPEIFGSFSIARRHSLPASRQGVDDPRSALSELVGTSTKARYFLFDEDPMFSKRENELIQEYLKKYGSMPQAEGEDDLDDLS